MNLFRAAMLPVSFCTSLMHVGAFMLVMAEISGLALMSRWLMMKSSSLPDGTPKTHLFELSFQRYSRKDAKVSSRSAMRVLEFLVLMTTSST
jgi:phage protein U